MVMKQNCMVNRTSRQSKFKQYFYYDLQTNAEKAKTFSLSPEFIFLSKIKNGLYVLDNSACQQPLHDSDDV
jgi:hypothetical protein